MNDLPDPELNFIIRRWGLFALALAVLLFFSACQKTPTGPGPPPAPPDTTSHNFSWQSFTFGGVHGSSYLLDVAIVNENDIWAVGEIHTAQTDTYDSLGNWQPPFNAVHWDGTKWELKRIFYNYQGSNFFRTIPSVFAFDENDVWFGNYTHWNGSKFESIVLNISFPSQANKIWGASSNNLYIVGINGLIAHYDGQGWQKIESGTDMPIRDIWGARNPETGEEEILALASNGFSVPQAKAVLEIHDNLVNPVSDQNLPLNLSGIWSANGKEWYVSGDGLFKIRALNSPWQEVTGPPLIYEESIRGNGPNDIFVVGDLGLVSHWNGSTWRTYPAISGNFYGLAVAGLVVAVGQVTVGTVGGSAAILMGRRN